MYRHSVLGGTFDRLHSGHKLLIRSATEHSKKITIGLTSDEMASHKYGHYPIQPYDTRKQGLEQYLNQIDASSKTDIVEIGDIYGPAVFGEDIEAIFATDSTRTNAEKVVKARVEKGLSKIDLIIVDEIKADDGGDLSSSRIRAGEINRDGRSYLALLKENTSYSLPDEMREDLKKPYGKVTNEAVFEGIAEKDTVITVGDIATAKIIRMRIIPDLSVFDLKTNRTPIEDEAILSDLPKTFHSIKNPAATISDAAINQLAESFEKLRTGQAKEAIRVDGEEDLLTIPCVLLAPLDAKLIYGLSGIGGVIIVITEEKKQQFVDVLARLTAVKT